MKFSIKSYRTVLLVLLCSCTPPATKDKAESAASRYIENGEYSKAVAVCNSALNQYPNALKLRLQRGLAYYHMEEYDACIADMEGVLAIEQAPSSNRFSALKLKAGALFAKGLYSDAADTYALLLAECRDDKWLFFWQRGLCRLYEGNYKDAESDFAVAGNEIQNNFQFNLHRAICSYKNDTRGARAKQYFKTAFRQDPVSVSNIVSELCVDKREMDSHVNQVKFGKFSLHESLVPAFREIVSFYAPSLNIISLQQADFLFVKNQNVLINEGIQLDVDADRACNDAKAVIASAAKKLDSGQYSLGEAKKAVGEIDRDKLERLIADCESFLVRINRVKEAIQRQSERLDYLRGNAAQQKRELMWTEANLEGENEETKIVKMKEEIDAAKALLPKQEIEVQSIKTGLEPVDAEAVLKMASYIEADLNALRHYTVYTRAIRKTLFGKKAFQKALNTPVYE